jgi:hypothetical protein
MATSNPGTEQKKASGFLALLIIGIFVLAQFGAIFIHPALDLFGRRGFLFSDGLALALTIVFGIVNFDNTFETNDNWKTYGGAFTIIYIVASTAIFISTGA